MNTHEQSKENFKLALTRVGPKIKLLIDNRDPDTREKTEKLLIDEMLGMEKEDLAAATVSFLMYQMGEAVLEHAETDIIMMCACDGIRMHSAATLLVSALNDSLGISDEKVTAMRMKVHDALQLLVPKE